MICGIPEAVEASNTLGESIVWDHRLGCFWWTDIPECTVLRLDWETRRISRFLVDRPICALALTQDPSRLLVATERDLGLLRFETVELEVLATPVVTDCVRLNDGRMDPWGRFVVGELADSAAGAAAAVHRFDADGRVQHLASGLSAVNGLAFDPDTGVAYIADSRLGLVWRAPYSQASVSLPLDEIFQSAPRVDRPDGACLDAGGWLWSAQYGAGEMKAFDRGGELVGTVCLPAPHATCCAFGGPDLDQLAVTTGRGASGGRGELYLVPTTRRGVRATLWAGSV